MKKISGKQNTQGFTLVELLVVISIIALLLAIMMPSLQKTREKAREIVCLNNTRQLGLSFETYSVANGGYYVPCAKDAGGDLSSGPVWYDRLKSTGFLEFKYNDPKVLHCPADKRKKKAYLYCSYSANRYVCGFTEPGTTIPPEYLEIWAVRKAGSVRRPSEVIMVGDGGTIAPIGIAWSVYGTTSMFFSGGQVNPNSANLASGFNWQRHSSKFKVLADRIVNCRSNIALADGHAQTFQSNFFNTEPTARNSDFVFNSPSGYPLVNPNQGR